MTRPMVSIVIPVKDGLENLRRLLDSTDRLDYPRDRLEVIVCDNGSRDGTPDLARSRGCRVLDLPKISIAALRNRGAAEAGGEYLAFVDSDCTVSEQWITAALRHLEGEGARREGVVAAGNYPVPPQGSTWVQELWTLKERLKPAVHEAAWLPSMNLIVRRTAFEAVNGFDEELRTCEDVDFCYRLRAGGGKIIWDSAIGVVHFGEPATLRVLFRKERWHGMDNIRGVLRHGLRREEMPSLILPAAVLAAYAIPIASLPAGLLTAGLAPLISSPLLLIPPALATAVALRVGLKAGRVWEVPQLTAIYLVYFTARAVALVPVG